LSKSTSDIERSVAAAKRKELQARDGAQAMAEYEAAAKAERAKTEKLRAMRLAREEAEAKEAEAQKAQAGKAGAPPAPPKKAEKKKKPAAGEKKPLIAKRR
jgi:hypothetical protein